MSSDLIDRDYILSALGVFNDTVHCNEHFIDGIATAKEIVRNAPTIEAEPKWISVKDRLPEDGGYYLVTCEGIERYVKTAFWVITKQIWKLGYVTLPNVTHWMPLPELPKEVNENGEND